METLQGLVNQDFTELKRIFKVDNVVLDVRLDSERSDGRNETSSAGSATTGDRIRECDVEPVRSSAYR